MTNFILRLVIGLGLAVLIMIIALNYLHIPTDQYLPMPMSYAHATKKTIGVVTKVEDLGFTDHWWVGADEEWYVDYAFRPLVQVVDPAGKVKYVLSPNYVTSSVRIANSDYDYWSKALQDQPKMPIEVFYDPANPTINGVQKTVGVYSRSSGYVGTWILYLFGLLVITVIIEEILKRWLPSE